VDTFRVYLKIQAMCLLCGIVGPIFLMVYFAVQPEPTLKWMYYWGLVITTIDVLLALGLTDKTMRARGVTREQQEARSR
jgi:hypothetical protein